MKIKSILFLLSSFPLLLTSCGNLKRYPSDKYETELKWKENFIVCHLGDLHISTLTNLPKTFEYLDKLIYSYDALSLKIPDVIVLNGDTFMDADKYVVDTVLDHINSWNIPFAFTYGNHDKQGLYSSNYINQKLLSLKNSVLKNPENDDVYGDSNYYINLRDYNDASKLKYQLYFLDSNTYVNMKYDSVHDNQIEWYKRTVIENNQGKNANEYAPSLMFMHIPTEQFVTAIDDFDEKYNKDNPNPVTKVKDDYSDCLKKVSSCETPTNLFNTIQELKSTVGICVNHDHINNTDLKYKGNGDWPVRLIYGSKSSTEIYYEERTLGACFYTLFSSPKVSKRDSTNSLYFSLRRVHLSYNQLIEERTILWENEY